MGALGHFLERQGIPTTGISLVREHTETIRPPRALWVTFELGRPMGIPGDAPFQRCVLRAALDLLARTDGPLIADHLEHIAEEADFTGWVKSRLTELLSTQEVDNDQYWAKTGAQ